MRSSTSLLLLLTLGAPVLVHAAESAFEKASRLLPGIWIATVDADLLSGTGFTQFRPDGTGVSVVRAVAKRGGSERIAIANFAWSLHQKPGEAYPTLTFHYQNISADSPGATRTPATTSRVQTMTVLDVNEARIKVQRPGRGVETYERASAIPDDFAKLIQDADLPEPTPNTTPRSSP